MSSVNRHTPLPPISTPRDSSSQNNSGSGISGESVTDAQLTDGKVTPARSDVATKPKMNLSQLSINDMFKELSARTSRLKLLNDFSTAICSADVQYLLAASKYGSDVEERDRVGQEMTSLGVVELFQSMWSHHFMHSFLSKEADPLSETMFNMLVVLWNMTDKCTAMCQRCLSVVLQKDLLVYLNDSRLEPTTLQKSIRSTRIVQGLMGVLHNILHRVNESWQPIREENAVTVIQRFRQSDQQIVACKALLLQGFLLTEDENERLNSDEHTFSFLNKVLVSALKGVAPEHRSKLYGFTAEETVVAINKLAANDNNKLRIVNTGFLPLYVQMLQPNFSVAEQTAAAQGLWTLAFKCPEVITKEPGCINALKSLAETSVDDSVRTHSRGALWILEGKGQNPATNVITKSVSQDNQKHVFISYQWDSKPTILMIRDRLKAAGFKIWVDVDNISGSVLEAMADAVEKASVVLICLTRKYKESPNCRTEGEYTFRRRQPIVPLRLEEKYTPDGWLGALCGNNVIYDFSAQSKIETSFGDLIKNLAKYNTKDSIDSKEQSMTPSVPTHERGIDVTSWKHEDIENWLHTNNLQHLQHWLSDYDGPMLNELMKMKNEAPAAFYSILKEENLTLKDILKLNCALKQLK